ncbi:hypothetical protein M758_UG321100 [Ceratodon purpureus]|nr:hypothetical protein M758_UG321100 [Ceratodon purpureus]
MSIVSAETQCSKGRALGMDSSSEPISQTLIYPGCQWSFEERTNSIKKTRPTPVDKTPGTQPPPHGGFCAATKLR